MYYFIVVLGMFFLQIVTYPGGFGKDTQIKTIRNFLKKFDMYTNEVRKSDTFEQLYRRQSRLNNGELLALSTYTSPYEDFPRPFFEGPYTEGIHITKIKTNKAIGINVSKKKRKGALDFDIICDPKQIFALSGGYRIHEEAQYLGKADSLLCRYGTRWHAKKIHEVTTIYNEDMDLYRIFAKKYCMVLLSRYGAMGLVSPNITEEK